MKILILIPRMQLEETVNYNYLFPLGLAYISSALKQAGHQVKCLNINHYGGSISAVINDFIKQHGPFDFACTGGISTVYQQVKSVVEALHAFHPSIRLILGGGLISSEPELMFDALKPDYIVIGEGEEAICDLLSCLERKGEIGGVAGIGYRDRMGKVVLTKARPPITDIDAIPWPDFEAFDFGIYLDHMRPSDQYFYDVYDYPRVYPIICSRSCPFSCTFCYHPIGKKYRQRSVGSIIAELSVMIRYYRINIISLYDELFSYDREWLSEFCREMKALLKEIPWECKWGGQMRVDKLDDEMLQAMRDAGCYSISYGFESYSPAVLESMKKHITPQQIDRAIKLTLDNNLCLQGNFIFGDPAETRQTAKETLDYWKVNVRAGIMLTFVNPYPGTELYQNCLTKGIIKDKLDFIENRIFGLFNMSDNMTDREFMQLWYDINKAVIKDRVYAKKWSVQPEKNGTFIISIECPHCQKTIVYKNFMLKSKHYFFTMLHCRSCCRRFFLASRLFRLAFNGLLLIYTLMPNFSFRFYEQIWPRRYLLRKALKRMRDSCKCLVRLNRTVKNA